MIFQIHKFRRKQRSRTTIDAPMSELFPNVRCPRLFLGSAQPYPSGRWVIDKATWSRPWCVVNHTVI